MKVGDKITFPFGTGEKEGVIFRLCDKTVYLKVDFPRHPSKIVKRSLHALETSTKGKKKQKKGS